MRETVKKDTLCPGNARAFARIAVNRRNIIPSYDRAGLNKSSNHLPAVGLRSLYAGNLSPIAPLRRI